MTPASPTYSDRLQALSFPPLRDLLPEHPSKLYKSVGQCIYCGVTDQLSDEHIIPLGLGGRFVLPDASCKPCARKTSEFERTCQRKMYGPLRLLYGLPSRRKKDRPGKLPLKVKVTEDSDWSYLNVNVDRFPFLVTFPMLGMPRLISGGPVPDGGAVTRKLWIRGASPGHDFNKLCRDLVRDLGVHTIMPESMADTPAFCRLLAKIAYALVVAETGAARPGSQIAGFAVGGDLTECLLRIGSRDDHEPPAMTLHDLDLVADPSERFQLVRVRLLARMGTPTYFVVVYGD